MSNSVRERTEVIYYVMNPGPLVGSHFEVSKILIAYEDQTESVSDIILKLQCIESDSVYVYVTFNELGNYFVPSTEKIRSKWYVPKGETHFTFGLSFDPNFKTENPLKVSVEGFNILEKLKKGESLDLSDGLFVIEAFYPGKGLKNRFFIPSNSFNEMSLRQVPSPVETKTRLNTIKSWFSVFKKEIPPEITFEVYNDILGSPDDFALFVTSGHSEFFLQKETVTVPIIDISKL